MSSLSVDRVVGGACAYSWVIMHLIITGKDKEGEFIQGSLVLCCTLRFGSEDFFLNHFSTLDHTLSRLILGIILAGF